MNENHKAEMTRIQTTVEQLTEQKTKLELEVLHTQEEGDKKVHEAEMEKLVLRAELEGSLQTNKRLEVENTELVRHLDQVRDESAATVSEMASLLQDSESLREELSTDLSRNRRTYEHERGEQTETIRKLREAVTAAKSAADDATYDKELSVKQLSAELSAALEAVESIKNERDQMELRLRRDMQCAREATEKYHHDLIIEQGKVKVQKEQTVRARHELMAATTAIEVLKQEKDGLTTKADELEIRCVFLAVPS